MVPAQKILDAAKEEGADIIGLSGLITPSLDEMVNFATEMERQGFDIPLLIGGATTSRAHTAVKVAQKYHGPVDLGEGRLAVGAGRRRAAVRRAAAQAAGRHRGRLRVAARAARRPSGQPRRCCRSPPRAPRRRRSTGAATPRRGRGCCCSRPATCAPDRTATTAHGGADPVRARRSRDYPLEELRDYIDWQPFFNAWEMQRPVPRHPATTRRRGEAARRLYDDAQAMLDRIIEEKWLRANGVFGLFPANQVDGDDIEVYTDESRTEVRTTLHQLRQQTEGRDGVRRASRWPTSSRPRTPACATTSARSRSPPAWASAEQDRGVQEGPRRLQRDPAGVAGRPARRGVRRAAARAGAQGVLGATRPTSTSTTTALIEEKYAGIRPAPGYPACPEHTEKQTIWELLDVEANTGIELTESMAMWPGAAVSGLYFSHPQSQYFVLGRDRPRPGRGLRRGARAGRVDEAEKWLSPNLGYRTENE